MTPKDPIGDPKAHAMPLSEVRHLLALEHVAVRANNTSYIDPLQYVTVWERTDQGVDAQLPVGAPILAPCQIKILAIEPNWYAGQPLVYFELLEGQQAGQVQYVAEEITDIAPAGLDPPAGTDDRPVRLARHRDRVRLVDAQRHHARARDHGLRGGRDHAGGHVHAQLAQHPRRERRALAAEVIGAGALERAVCRVADQHRLGFAEAAVHLARLEERHQQPGDRDALTPQDRGPRRRPALEVRRGHLARERRGDERRSTGSGSGPSTAAPR